MIRILSPTAMPRLLARRKARLAEAEAVVRPILEAVRARGDKALMEYARQFDALDRKTVAVPAADLQRACAGLSTEFRDAVATAQLLGVRESFQRGGAQAIAAFAYGTRSVPRADRIVGPGSIYVAAAKKLLAGDVGIDFVAGPTEILIICADGNPRHLAADMLAQAEHDVDAAAILLTTSKRLANAVAKEIEHQLADLPTAAVARKAIQRNSAIILVRSLDDAVELSNRFAPEHLSIPDDRLLARVQHAGSIFIGPFSTEAAGDYASGPNHVLPTSGVARLRGGLSVADYLKVISVQRLSRDALAALAPAITTLARAEGLEAHARSVEVRTCGADLQVYAGPPGPAPNRPTWTSAAGLEESCPTINAGARRARLSHDET